MLNIFSATSPVCDFMTINLIDNRQNPAAHKCRVLSIHSTSNIVFRLCYVDADA